MPISQLEPVNENCDWLYQLSSRAVPFTHLVQTTILPFFLALTVIINILLCITLNRPNMRTPTNFILLAISVADLLTGLLPLPILTAFNTDYFDTDLTLVKGYLTHYCSVVLPTIFHTISIWLTVLLALQRFIYVVKPLEVYKYAICHYRGVAISIFIISISALIFYANNFSITYNSGAVVCTNSQKAISSIHSKMLKCTFLPRNIQFPILLLRALTVHIIPCLLLCVLTAYMLVALKGISKRRNELLKKQKEMRMLANSIRMADNHNNNVNNQMAKRNKKKPVNGDVYKTSRIMLVVLLLFLFVEIPSTVLVTTYSLLIALQGKPMPYFSEVGPNVP
ncbi:unnamed protein product [Rodentolepis nana]|uniref:G_PROTEIN_RECEP_F1_2 domain-containing protein n=1 Tax=Rodentolepis nana TaxID=102285 RepID=A0A0R3TCM1_RODNA|nr:unnamed protein product [Rodentolepis nana]